MAAIDKSFLHKAIHSEITARDAYASISEKIEVPEGKRVMLVMSAEEEKHRVMLSDRYKTLTGEEFNVDSDSEPGPDFDFIERSTFSRTDALEALTLCLGAEIDAISYYSKELTRATETEDMRMLKALVKFEKKHKKKLEKEIKRLRQTNHWNL